MEVKEVKEVKATIEEKRGFIKGLLENAGSHFITIYFIKKDGTERMMNIQQESMKYHVLGENATERGKKAVETRKANNPNLMAVYDVQKQEIRSVNLDTTFKVKTAGVEYRFVD